MWVYGQLVEVRISAKIKDLDLGSKPLVLSARKHEDESVVIGISL